MATIETGMEEIQLEPASSGATDQDTSEALLVRRSMEYARTYISEQNLNEEEFKEMLRKCGRIRILATGACGVGKSTLLNGLVGKKIFDANQDNLDPVTTQVTQHEFTEKGVNIIVFDSPGLHDGLHEEERYVQQMVGMIKNHGGLDLILYCKRMDRPVADINEERSIMIALTSGLAKLENSAGRQIGIKIYGKAASSCSRLLTCTKNSLHEAAHMERLRSNLRKGWMSGNRCLKGP